MSLKVLSSQVSYCSKCDNFSTSQQRIPGKGNSQAKIMIVNSAPSEQTDKSGDPFVGLYGTLLTKILSHTNMTINDVYHTFAVKCYPGNSSSMKSQCVSSCSPFIKRQIALIQPQLIITFGIGSYYSLTGNKHPQFNKIKQQQLEIINIVDKHYSPTKMKFHILPLKASSLLTQKQQSQQRRNAAISVIRQIRNISKSPVQVTQ